MLEQKHFEAAAKLYDLEVAVIRAVASVESSGNGFLSDGKPVILFEPHIFWRELAKRGINPRTKVKGNEDILYEEWGAKPYGKSSQQHGRLERAEKIHKEAALKSASWGMFQIMGFNYEACGCKTIDEFINKIYSGEEGHLELFLNYIKARGLLDELRAKKWAAFAEAYNGKSYKKNKYDTKMEEAYKLLTKAKK